MQGKSALVQTVKRQTHRQIARALHAGGIDVTFADDSAQVLASCSRPSPPDLLIMDAEDAPGVEDALLALQTRHPRPAVIVLCVASNKQPLIDLIEKHDIGNLVAKHGAIRAAPPVIDERELLVTCRKVLSRDIFGIDKYIGAWGVVEHRSTISDMPSKSRFLGELREYLAKLDCQERLVPEIVNVADELTINAMIHAPRDESGRPKYRDRTFSQDLSLLPSEHVTVTYACDGLRLMISVSDNFGRLDKSTLNSYLTRAAQPMIAPEEKPSGVGLGISLSLRGIHQLIFNIHDRRRTEVIGGWWLRVNNGAEFRKVGKSLNAFWLPMEVAPLADAPSLHFASPRSSDGERPAR